MTRPEEKAPDDAALSHTRAHGPGGGSVSFVDQTLPTHVRDVQNQMS